MGAELKGVRFRAGLGSRLLGLGSYAPRTGPGSTLKFRPVYLHCEFCKAGSSKRHVHPTTSTSSLSHLNDKRPIRHDRIRCSGQGNSMLSFQQQKSVTKNRTWDCQVQGKYYANAASRHDTDEFHALGKTVRLNG